VTKVLFFWTPKYCASTEHYALAV